MNNGKTISYATIFKKIEKPEVNNSTARSRKYRENVKSDPYLKKKYEELKLKKKLKMKCTDKR